MWIEAPIPLATLPNEPGVYRMLDQQRCVIYVGKARNLRKRVSSYFQRQPESPRTVAMVRQIHDIVFSTTPSEAEALIVEHNLIKQLKPRYNILMKDSKSYPYIRLTTEKYPRLLLYRGNRQETGKYFGPYPNAGAVHATMQLMQQIFQLRDCDPATFNNRSRPCMQHQIQRCSAPCCHLVTPEQYRKQVDEAIAFLSGEDQTLIACWQQEMQQAAEQQHFEKAAQLRDRIQALRTVISGSNKNHLPDHADAITILRHHQHVLAAIGIRRNGHDLGIHNITINQASDATDEEVLQTLLTERYGSEPPPTEILINAEDSNCAELQRLLQLLHSQQRCHVTRPQRGDRNQWLQQVQRSGEQLLASRKPEHQQAAYQQLAELLQLDSTPKCLAAVDNAHLGGKQTVAAITYANWQGAEKRYYRRYKLDGVGHAVECMQGDDYAAMDAVLQRFFNAINQQDIPCPDLMLIDGGRGQLAIAIACAQKAELHHLKLLAVAKGDSRKIGEEVLWPGWLPSGEFGIGSPLRPGRHSPALLLIARVRDEAHRFAGAYMRKRKKQSMFTSILDRIEGIGSNKRAALLKHFGGIEGVKKAGREQLAEAPGISTKLAARIFDALHR